MAFGTPRTNSPFLNTSTNSGTGVTAPSGGGGSISVSIGDLIVVLYASRATSPTWGTPPLTASFTGGGACDTFALLTPYDSGQSVVDVGYARVTAAGTLTQVAASHTSRTNHVAMIVSVFEGPFAVSPLDLQPAGATDSVSPFDCPLSGTLSQANELILGFFAASNGLGTSFSAVSPATMCGQASSGTGSNSISGYMNYNVVSATTSTYNSFTNAANPSSSGAAKTATFKQGVTRRRFAIIT